MELPNLVVRNTFIDAVPEDVEADSGDLNRTQSDPTGGRSKMVVSLGRPPGLEAPKKQQLSLERLTQPPSRYDVSRVIVQEGTADEEGVDGMEGTGKVVEDRRQVGFECEENDEEEEDEEDDDDDEDSLARTVTYDPRFGPVTPTHSTPSAPSGAGVAAKSDARTVTLNRLLPGGPGATEESGAAPGRWHQSAANVAEYAAYTGPAVSEMWTHPASYGSMFPGYGAMYSPYGFQQPGPAEQAISEYVIPPLGSGPPLGNLHSFHQETRDMGVVAPDFRNFTKVGYEGRLSVVSESKVHTGGCHRYLVQFSAGELSRADGVGFVFAQRLPCAKNIQRIVSIFVNQRGRICMRVFADIVRASAYVKAIELGDWVEMAIDLDKQHATFNIWPRTATGWPMLTGQPSSTAEFPFGAKLLKLNQASSKQVKLNTGHLACVVKNVGVTVALAS